MRIWNLALKELIQLWRDKLILLFVLLGPVTELAMVAWATSGSIDHLPTAIVDWDQSASSRACVVALENTETFDADFYPPDEEGARALVDSGSAAVAILIPAGFQKDLVAFREPAQVRLDVLLQLFNVFENPHDAPR